MTFSTLRFALPLFLAASIFAPAAHAQTAPEPAPTPRVTTSQWYGWETLLVDGAALTTMIASGVRSNNGLAPVGYGLFVLGPPLVHVAHGHIGTGLADAGMRFLLPIAVGALGYAIDYSMSSCNDQQWLCFRGLGGAVIGAFIGYATAVTLDAAVLAREPVVRVPEKRVDSARVRWTPTLQLNQGGGASGGVAGMF
jgi:hypothetical protein